MNYRAVGLLLGASVLGGGCTHEAPPETRAPSSTAHLAYATSDENCRPMDRRLSQRLRTVFNDAEKADPSTLKTLVDAGILVCGNAEMEKDQNTAWPQGQYIGGIYHGADRVVSLNMKYTIGNQHYLLENLAALVRAGKLGQQDLFAAPPGFGTGRFGLKWEVEADFPSAKKNPKLRVAPVKG